MVEWLLAWRHIARLRKSFEDCLSSQDEVKFRFKFVAVLTDTYVIEPLSPTNIRL